MAFITNQFLKGNSERSRSYNPITVSLTLNTHQTPWRENHEVISILQATRKDGNYQMVYFTQPDLDYSVLGDLVRKASEPTRSGIAIETLLNFSTAEKKRIVSEVLEDLSELEFISFIGEVCSSRSENRRKRAARKAVKKSR